MISHWYLVKRNWPQVKTRLPLYAGLGGEVWPFDFGFNFDTAKKNQLQDLHARMERSEKTVKFGSQPTGICTDANIAKEYYMAVKETCGEAWLLEVAHPDVSFSHIYGFDIGLPSGGFSVVETELITQGLPGPKLNEWGLIQKLSEAVEYLEARNGNEKLEQLDQIMIVSIRVLLKN